MKILERLIPNRIKQQRKINKLENEVETLKETIKNELFKEFIGKIKDYDELQILRKENKNLRIKIKKLKEEVKKNEN